MDNKREMDLLEKLLKNGKAPAFVRITFLPLFSKSVTQSSSSNAAMERLKLGSEIFIFSAA